MPTLTERQRPAKRVVVAAAMTAVVCCTGMFAWTQSNLACNECSRACSGPREPTREPSNTPSPTGAPTLGPTSYPIRRKWLGPKRRSYKISSRGDVVAYHSSAAEHEWLDGQRTGKICSTATSRTRSWRPSPGRTTRAGAGGPPVVRRPGRRTTSTCRTSFAEQASGS